MKQKNSNALFAKCLERGLPADIKGQLPTAKQLADAMKGEMGRMKDELQRS